MSRTQTELTYLRASIESASSVDLVIILLDMLMSDLRGAVDALSKNDVERRAKELKHAFLVLEQLEASVDTNSGVEAASALSRYYAAVRVNIMNGHAKASAEMLNHQIELLSQIRATWADVARKNASPAAVSRMAESLSSFESEQTPTLAGSWSV